MFGLEKQILGIGIIMSLGGDYCFGLFNFVWFKGGWNRKDWKSQGCGYLPKFCIKGLF